MKPKLKQAMDDACRVLQAAGIQFDQVDDYQLKVGSWSFYPTKGTIFRDEDDRKDPRSGLAAFIAILKQHNLCPQRPAQKPSSPRLVSDRVPARSSKSRPEHIKLGGGEFMSQPAEPPIKEIIITLSPDPAPDSSRPPVQEVKLTPQTCLRCHPRNNQSHPYRPLTSAQPTQTKPWLACGTSSNSGGSASQTERREAVHETKLS